MEVCVIAKCTYNDEYSGDFCVNKELIACEKGESSCSSTVEDRNEFLGGRREQVLSLCCRMSGRRTYIM
ncbi:unnamed protein product [Prunus brigantina]